MPIIEERTYNLNDAWRSQKGIIINFLIDDVTALELWITTVDNISSCSFPAVYGDLSILAAIQKITDVEIISYNCERTQGLDQEKKELTIIHRPKSQEEPKTGVSGEEAKKFSPIPKPFGEDFS